ncbi:MAG: hypothetical protein RJB55_2033 [Verrucomicrobiota bacterium]
MTHPGYPADATPSRMIPRRSRGPLIPLVLLLAAAATAAAATATGSVAGRVSSPATGDRVEGARVSVEGTGLEAFSDSTGAYRIAGIPAGPARLRVFHTAYAPGTASTGVAAGAESRLDLDLTPIGGTAVKLDRFVVATDRAMTGAAIAINTQRFAPNLMTAVAADEFGTIADGNVGEILKFLPGVTAEFNSGEPRQVAINGASSANLPVTVNSFALASAQASTTRAVELYSVSTNNLSRVEVVYSPTPESPGAALAGSVNMVTQSAFDRARPLFTGTAFLLMRDNARDLRRSPFPNSRLSRTVNPGFDFSHVAPVSPRWGFTVSGSRSEQYQDSRTLQTTWRGASGPTNGGTLPDTTPDNPYLTDFSMTHGPRTESRSSLGATVDVRTGPAGRLSLAIHRVDFGAEFHNRTLGFLVNRVAPGDHSLNHTRGFAGAGEVRLTNSGRHRSGSSLSPSVTFRHHGPVWRAEAGFGHSQASTIFRDLARGFFQSSLARRTGVTVSFADIVYYRPGTITVTDPATGAIVDPTRLDTYALSTAGSTASESRDLQRTAYVNAARDLPWRLPLTLKAGLDARESRRDLRGLNSPFNFVGADGRASLAPAGGDDGAGAVPDTTFSRRTPGFGFSPQQWVDNAALLRLYQERPTVFTADLNSAYRNAVNLSKHAGETVWSAFLRADAALADRRLRLTGGVRAEQTNVAAEGPLTDAARNFQRDAGGRVLTAANGQPLAMPGDALQVSQRTLIDRGLRVRKEYLRWFPSLNASWNLRENLILRGAAYVSIGRPDFNQYAGGLTLPNTESPPGPGNRITVNNAAIKPWSARSRRLSLEWYTGGAGLVSLAAFRRDIDNFFGSAVFNATPPFLALYGLDPAVYDPYDVATTQNLPGGVRMEGLDFSWRQALAFLPAWAGGVQVFANASTLRALGDPAANFAGFAPRTANWGVSLARERFTLKLNWNFRGRLRQAKVADGRSIDPDTYNWSSSRLYLNVASDLHLGRGWTLFANLRNVTSVYEDVEITSPRTPAVAQLRSRADFGSLWSFGLRTTR